jgi:branched-chain amino acid transport system substrate-binding protein
MSYHTSKPWRAAATAILGLSLLSGLPVLAQEATKQYIPIPTYRVGAYASSGVPIFGGLIDYFRYINDVEGGVNGVKLVWDECETNYEVGKGIECYERVKGGKDGAPVAAFLPLNDILAKALTERTAADKIPQMAVGFGLTEAIDGRVFPYSFPLTFSFWSEASSAINFIAEKEGGKDKLRNLKIVTLYHDSPYGKETQTPITELAKKYEFEDIQIAVPHPGNDQSAQWGKIRQLKPDWVFLRGWGVMTPVAIKTAAKVGFPVDHIVGGTWSSSEEDVRPAGAVAKGYFAITPFPPGTDYEIHKRLKQAILDKGLSNLQDLKSFGSVYYNAGLNQAIITVEAIRTAQKKFGARPMKGEEMQWGYENLNIDDARLKEIGALGLLQPLKLSMKDHEGGGAAKALQWDGSKWNVAGNDWIKSDRDLLLPLIYERAAAYAKEKGITPRSEAAN